MQVEQRKAEYFSEVEAGNHLFERLLSRPGRFLVYRNVVRRYRKNEMLIVESAPFAIDRHRQAGVYVKVCDFGNVSAYIHVRGVAAGPKDAANLDFAVRVCGCYESTGCIVHQRGQLDGKPLHNVKTLPSTHATYPRFQCSFKLRHNVMTFNPSNVEALRPSLQVPMVNGVLRYGI